MSGRWRPALSPCSVLEPFFSALSGIDSCVRSFVLVQVANLGLEQDTMAIEGHGNFFVLPLLWHLRHDFPLYGHQCCHVSR